MAGDEVEAGVAVSGGRVDSKYLAGRDVIVYESPTASASKPPPFYLPQKPTNFVARETYFEKMRTALLGPEGGMFLLSGDPGSGKTSLAQTFAWQVQKQFEAVVYQTCGQRSVEIIAGELADTLKEQIGDHLTQLPAEKKLEEVKKWLQHRRSLLVLDDVWLTEETNKTPLGAAAPHSTELHLQDLLPGPPVSVLFTSRRPALPWVAAAQRLTVEAFTEGEVEDTFRVYLGAQTLERHRQALLQFAERVERLPLAVAVGAQLLQEEFGPLEEAARSLELSRLISEVHDVPGLLERAIRAQGEAERQLLAAAAVCSAESFWLPLAVSIAGLDPAQGAAARNRLVNAALLRVTDQDRQRFHLHSLLRDQVRRMSSTDLQALEEKHARVLGKLFSGWERDWGECRECLIEVTPAARKLFGAGEQDRGARLMYAAGEMAQRIGELALGLQIEAAHGALWASLGGRAAREGLQRSYGNQALILKAWGRLEEAMALHKKKEAICQELGNKDSLQICYGNQALILQDWGRLDEAMALHKQQEAISEELGHRASLQMCYGNQAVILQAWGRLEEAMALYKRQEAICEELGNKDDLQRSYGNQAGILQAWGRLEEAMALLKRQEAICKELGNRGSLGYCYWNWGLLAHEMKDEATARAKLEEALAIFTELKMPRERDAVQQELDRGEGGGAG